MTFNTSKGTNLIVGTPINSFLGQKDSKDVNVLNMPAGQLISNQNMEYIASGSSIYLKTKRGSTLIKDITNKAQGAGNYMYNLTTPYFVWVDAEGNLKRYKETGDTITTLKTGISISNKNVYVPFGLGTNSALYGCNSTDGVYKVSGSTPAYSAIASSPKIDFMCFSAVSGRMIGVAGDTMYYTEIQLTGSTTATKLETWNITVNTAKPSPDDGEGFKCCVDNGQATFLFKDTGIWILPNAEELPIHWFFPKANADTGTKSPHTCKLTRYGNAEGIIYLGSDKTLRFFDAQIERNAGVRPTIVGGSSKIISKQFQSILNEIPTAQLSKCTATYFNRYYILNVVGVGETEISKTIIIDTEKLIQESSLEYPQPYWFNATNMNNNCYVVRKADNALYGFNKDGYISKLLVDDVYNEAVPTRVTAAGELAIEWAAYLGWIKASNSEVELAHGYLHWGTEGKWSIQFMVNSFVSGQSIPEFDTGTWSTLKPETVGGSYFDIDLFDVARFAPDTERLSQNINNEARGNYFLYGFKGSTLDEWASVYGVESMFKQVRTSPLGRR